jgi:hypothetical protein
VAVAVSWRSDRTPLPPIAIRLACQRLSQGRVASPPVVGRRPPMFVPLSVLEFRDRAATFFGDTP